jgi:hypothetical protein
MDLFDYAESRKKDEALDHFDHTATWLVEKAKTIALRLSEKQGTVTSPEVLQILEREVPGLLGRDPRFMGAVFRSGWERVGFVASGSHRRMVSLWRRLD